MFAVSYPGNPRIGLESRRLGDAYVPPRSGPGVVVADIVRLEDEMIGDAMCEVSLIHVAASVGLGCDDVVFSIREIEPVLGSVIELETDLGPTIVFRNAVANSKVTHLPIVVHRRVEGIASGRRME